MDKRKLFVRVAIVDELTLPEEETLNEKQPHGIKLDIWSQPFSIDLNKPKSAPYTTSWVSARQADGSLNTLKLSLLSVAPRSAHLTNWDWAASA